MEHPVEILLIHTQRPLFIAMKSDPSGGTEFFAAGKRIAVGQVTADARETLDQSGLMDEPHRVGLLGHETGSGVDALVVLVMDSDEAPDGLPGQWDSERPSAKPTCVILGRVVRPAEDRLPGTLQDELHDMLRDMVGDSGGLTSEQQIIENLLRTL